MITLIGLSDSLRRGSFNTALLRAAAAMMPVESEPRIESIAGIPLYDGDVESAHGVPEPTARLKDAIDWLSRPADDARDPRQVPQWFRGFRARAQREERAVTRPFVEKGVPPPLSCH